MKKYYEYNIFIIIYIYYNIFDLMMYIYCAAEISTEISILHSANLLAQPCPGPKTTANTNTPPVP